MTTAFIFGLLIVLMLTGMPISIALGLTVLTFLYVMTEVPIEAVALKLFTGIESFEIMAIPFFILAGNFLTHGGVARRMINFATSLIGHWYGGLGLAGVMACALFAAVSGSSPATVVAIGSLVLPAMLQQGFPRRFGAGVITTTSGGSMCAGRRMTSSRSAAGSRASPMAERSAAMSTFTPAVHNSAVAHMAWVSDGRDTTSSGTASASDSDAR